VIALNPFDLAEQNTQEHTQAPAIISTQPLEAAPTAIAPPQVAPPQVVNINTADQAQLETLPGIGPAKAQAILEWRMVYGRFTDVFQLREVSGIGEKTLEKLLPYVVV